MFDLLASFLPHCTCIRTILHYAISAAKGKIVLQMKLLNFEIKLIQTLFPLSHSVHPLHFINVFCCFQIGPTIYTNISAKVDCKLSS